MSQIIVLLDRQNLSLYQVDLGKTLASKLLSQIPATLETLSDAFLSQKKLLQTPFRLLLDDSLCYIHELADVPLAHPQDEEFIENKVKEIIPENFQRSDWDIKTVKQGKDFKTVIVFAPVKVYKDTLDQITSKLKLSITATEPKSLALARHPDPVIGLALKPDLTGNDEQVLNLTYQSSSAPSSKLPIILAIVVILIMFVGGLFYLFSQKKPTPKVTQPTPTVTVTPMPLPSTSTLVSFDRSQIKINVLNGSGKTGLANAVGNQIKGLGYQVTTGNADNSQYSHTLLKLKIDTHRSDILHDLNDVLNITEDSVTIDNTLLVDAIVILGKN